MLRAPSTPGAFGRRPPSLSAASSSAGTRIAMSIPDAVIASGLSRSFLYRAMTRGELAFIKKGRRRLIPTTALADYLQRSDGNESDAARLIR